MPGITSVGKGKERIEIRSLLLGGEVNFLASKLRMIVDVILARVCYWCVTGALLVCVTLHAWPWASTSW